MKVKSRHSVLIVDDDEDDRVSIKDAFLKNEHDHDFLFMQNGEQLLKYLNTKEKEKFATIILLDLNMPGIDGRDILKELKENKSFQPIPVIVLTISSSLKDRERSYELGANCFITKPSSYTQLLEITDSIARLWLAAHN